MTVILPKINLEIRTFVASQALGASELAPWRPQVYMNLNTLSTQTPRRQELLGHIKKEWQIEMMAMFDPEKGFKFHAQPKLVHIIVLHAQLVFICYTHYIMCL